MNIETPCDFTKKSRTDINEKEMCLSFLELSVNRGNRKSKRKNLKRSYSDSFYVPNTKKQKTTNKKIKQKK
eukprot:UN22335